MFKKLKEKLKGWVKKSSEEIEEKAPKQEISFEKQKPEKKTKKQEKLKKQAESIIKIKDAEDKLLKEEKKLKKTEKEDPIEILAEKSKKTIKETLKEKKDETPTDIKQKLNETKAKEIEKLEKDIEEQKQKIEQAKSPDKNIQTKEENIPEKKQSFFSRFRSGFQYKITEEEFNNIFDDLEMLLLENNVALEVVEDIKKTLSEKLINKELKKEMLQLEIKKELKNTINEILIEPDDPLEIIQLKKQESKDPFIILFFGINGAGKTTSIAKFVYKLKQKNYSVVLAAADTFRAAAIQQLQEHAERLNVPVIKHDYGSDPSAVGFDAIKYAKNHNFDVVLIDTAGRMHTKTNLLSEMEKICRVTNPDLKIFVAESIAGNDATEQAKSFHEMIEIDGSILSKADIDEKGGTIISISHATKKPIFYLGTGQNYSDLKLFNKKEFLESLGLKE